MGSRMMNFNVWAIFLAVTLISSSMRLSSGVEVCTGFENVVQWPLLGPAAMPDFTPEVIDNIFNSVLFTGDIEVSQEPEPGQVITVGEEIEVTFRAVDTTDMEVACFIAFEALDRGQPNVVIDGVEDEDEFLSTDTISLILVASDDIDPMPTATLLVDNQEYVPGMTFDLGFHTINATATDSAGNVGFALVVFEVRSSPKFTVEPFVEAYKCEVSNGLAEIDVVMLLPSSGDFDVNTIDILSVNLWLLSEDGLDINRGIISPMLDSSAGTNGVLLHFHAGLSAQVTECPSFLELTGSGGNEDGEFDIRAEVAAALDPLPRLPVVVEPNCRNIMAGSMDVVGEVCASVAGDNLVQQITVYKPSCNIIEAHICNIPTETMETDGITRTVEFSLNIEKIYDFVCTFVEGMYTIAGHITIECHDEETGRHETQMAYYEIELYCPFSSTSSSSTTTTTPGITVPPNRCKCEFKEERRRLPLIPQKQVVQNKTTKDQPKSSCWLGQSFASATALTLGGKIFGSGLAWDNCPFQGASAATPPNSYAIQRRFIIRGHPNCMADWECSAVPSIRGTISVERSAEAMIGGAISISGDCGRILHEGAVSIGEVFGQTITLGVDLSSLSAGIEINIAPAGDDGTLSPTPGNLGPVDVTNQQSVVVQITSSVVVDVRADGAIILPAIARATINGNSGLSLTGKCTAAAAAVCDCEEKTFGPM